MTTPRTRSTMAVDTDATPDLTQPADPANAQESPPVEPAIDATLPGMDAAPDAAADAVSATPPPTAHQALYRKWRAQRFAEVIGQDPIVDTLRRAVATDRVAHAYLLVGPRGTGKTSTARILAKAINCLNRGEDGEPCDTCTACVSIREGRALDVIEIDAASHGLVEDARDLVMRALTAPSDLRKRVYIIDEVHMLSTHAFNALLKLVEEPPDHVVFILATTDTHKVPSTIISRTQRFEFRRLQTDAIAGKLARISTAEGAESDPDALALIARLADGGMRDAESLLDQVLAYAGDHVTASAVREAVGLADDEAVSALIDAFVAGDAPAALATIELLADAGRDIAQVASQAEEEARRRLLASAGDPPRARRLATILRTVAEAAGVGAREGRARLLLELLSVEPAEVRSAAPAPGPAPAPPVRQAAPSRQAPRDEPTAAAKPAGSPEAEPPAKPVAAKPVAAKPVAAAPEPVAAAEPLAANGDRPALDLIRVRWAEVVQQASPAIRPLLRECRPVALTGPRLTLAFPEERAFMREKTSNRAASIEQLLATLFGGSWAIECIASNVELEPLTLAAAVAADPEDPDARALLEGVLKITGGQLVDVPEVR
ncbi:MAG: DNA polymerase III subunit gamma/tau [Chloroflexota bacterium]|nr:DNA polymerase III subunit gamma/tau [Chloroflexota bacterium]